MVDTSSLSLTPHKNIDNLILKTRPHLPLHIIDPSELARTAQIFRDSFSGTVMYAVKCNPHPEIIKGLNAGGVTHFDVASIEEVRLIRRLLPEAILHFMHTVKSREAIREAYFEHGVRIFVVDCADELHKILKETQLAADLEIYIRLALPKNAEAAVDFSAKFGATPDIAPALLREARLVAAKLGIMFHPGSQSRNPDVFRRGIKLAGQIISESGVKVESLDVGGGFPAQYPQQGIPPLGDFIKAIAEAVAENNLGHLALYCEPGRALVASSTTLVVRVELRKGNALYLNDGVYGSLIEMLPTQGGFAYPMRAIFSPDHTESAEELTEYRFCGPTCDSYDMMAGPFALPENIQEGDWIAIGMAGAYNIACRTDFNGFGKNQTLLLAPDAENP